MHTEGMVHRDIKPDNIIITPDRESAYLVDWGIALSQEEASRLTSGGWIGTPGYMSPEQQAGENVDSRSDLYSLGVTLYEALAGFPIPQSQYRELSLINQAVPPGIDEMKAWRQKLANSKGKLLIRSLYERKRRGRC